MLALGTVISLVMVPVWIVSWFRGRLANRGGLLMRVSPFSALPGLESGPSFSPDGAAVAFAWTGESGEATNIYRKAVGSDAPVRLTAGRARDSMELIVPERTVRQDLKRLPPMIARKNRKQGRRKGAGAKPG